MIIQTWDEVEAEVEVEVEVEVEAEVEAEADFEVGIKTHAPPLKLYPLKHNFHVGMIVFRHSFHPSIKQLVIVSIISFWIGEEILEAVEVT